MAKKKSGRVSNIKELNEEINKILIQALNDKNSVTANVIKETESDMVEREVYAKYTPNNGKPWIYEQHRDKGRRGKDGGLADTRNMEHEAAQISSKIQLKVLNLTSFNENYNFDNYRPGDTLANLVEGGDKKYGAEYTFKSNRSGDAYKYLGARPFQQETVKELERNGDHLDALALDLMMKGLTVERKGK